MARYRDIDTGRFISREAYEGGREDARIEADKLIAERASELADLDFYSFDEELTEDDLEDPYP